MREVERITVEIIPDEVYGPYIIRRTWENGRIETMHGFRTIEKARKQIAELQEVEHRLNASHPDTPMVMFNIIGDALR